MSRWIARCWKALKDPLLHLVRNAVDHGIERPDERQAAGKPARATVTVSAALRGDRVEVVVADDGRGFDVDRIRAKLRAKGIPVSEDDREVARLAFLPGISTAAMVTDVSGRGVGLDVVQDRIESLHGSVDVSFRAGAGTSFALTVPLTLTTIRCVLVTAGGPTYAVATTSVAQFLRFRRSDVRSVAGREVLLLGESPIPVASLAETLGQPRPAAVPPGDKTSAVILTAGEQQVAFVVDQFLTEQEVLVKSLGARLRRMRHVTGATLLPTGQVALVLNAASVIRTALGQATRRFVADADQPARQQRWRLLVVEDSLTTRTLMKSILEAAGYEISVAVDGEQAWRLLAEQAGGPGRHRRGNAADGRLSVDGRDPRIGALGGFARRAGHLARERCGQAARDRSRGERLPGEKRLRSGELAADDPSNCCRNKGRAPCSVSWWWTTRRPRGNC